MCAWRATHIGMVDGEALEISRHPRTLYKHTNLRIHSQSVAYARINMHKYTPEVMGNATEQFHCCAHHPCV